MVEVREGFVDMDTPDRSKAQTAASLSKLEESPLFNFLNNLSPIEPFKSADINRTLNALNFASLPSIFTSPHANSLKDYRFLKRHEDEGLDPSKPEFSSDNSEKSISEGGISYFYRPTEQVETNDQCNSLTRVVIVKSEESSKFAVDFMRSMNYDCSSPISGTKTSLADEFIPFSEFAANSRELLSSTGVSSEKEKDLSGKESYLEEISQITQGRDITGCDWNVISDVADLLISDSSLDLRRSGESLGDATGFYSDIVRDTESMERMRSIEDLGGTESDYPSSQPASSQPGHGSCMNSQGEVHDTVAGSSVENGCLEHGIVQKVNCEPVSNLCRGMRRCLVFETVGTCRKYPDENKSSVSLGGDTPDNDKHLVLKSNKNGSKCNLPGIGLHLNVLAIVTKDHTDDVKQDASGSCRLVIAPGSTADFHSLVATQKLPSFPLAETSSEGGLDPSHASVQNMKEEPNQTSPKKKRRRLEFAGENESACKRCNCKKSKCLKLYCECFAAGVYCTEPCYCQECFNKPLHKALVLETRKQIESRDPLAFVPRVIKRSESSAEAGDDSSTTPASARHKRGCNCKKSGCLKKYCECYQGGVGCSFGCRCEGCKNAFGRKDGMDLEDHEIVVLESSVKDRISLKTTILDNGHQNPESAPPGTPHFERFWSSGQLSFSSKVNPTPLSIWGRLHGKPSFPLPPKFDQNLQTLSEEEMPEFLRGSGSHPAAVKSSSPNSKRVSSPHGDFGMSSPGRRSSRKLILQSIPGFSSIDNNQ